MFLPELPGIFFNLSDDALLTSKALINSFTSRDVKQFASSTGGYDVGPPLNISYPGLARCILSELAVDAWFNAR